MKHKHHEVIVAWATDTSKVVQFRRHSDAPWTDVPGHPTWNSMGEYRIKPEPKPDVVVTGILEIDDFQPITLPDYRTQFRVSEHYEKDNIRLTFDGETGKKLLKAEVL